MRSLDRLSFGRGTVMKEAWREVAQVLTPNLPFVRSGNLEPHRFTLCCVSSRSSRSHVPPSPPISSSAPRQLIVATRRVSATNPHRPTRTTNVHPQMKPWYVLGAQVIGPRDQ